jgi:hypothetical protein
MRLGSSVSRVVPEGSWTDVRVRGARVLVVAEVVFLLSVVACGGATERNEAESGSTARVSMTSAALDSELQVPPGDLSGELLDDDELPGNWATPGPISASDLIEGETINSICPHGESASVAGSSGSDGDAQVVFSSIDDEDHKLTQVLMHDDAAAKFEAFVTVFRSCVGPSFEQGDDPVETVRYEELEIHVPEANVAAFVERWGTGGRLDGGEVGHVLLSLGDVLLLLTEERDGASEPFDSELLTLAATSAVDRLRDGTWSTGVLDAPVAPELGMANEVIVEQADEIIIRPAGGCRFHEGEVFSYSMDGRVPWGGGSRSLTLGFVGRS